MVKLTAEVWSSRVELRSIVSQRSVSRAGTIFKHLGMVAKATGSVLLDIRDKTG